MTYHTKSLAPEFVIWFARNQVNSANDLVRIFAGDDFLDAHVKILDKAENDYQQIVEGVVGAVLANRAGE